ncbi:IPT/TIG domain-containing protein [Kitasatospora sp. GP82]|uniref:IPT/TIG domain-containing protein n=1 Tax=Kitasatospora sp. GP82 TaxID=3035089 RepID=UPI00247495E9|nr:IPT/TIG domain-containing protein [Kitasatospora sp. GP82]MDH6127385.1 hypothetical protein [Kitasatospora sp. GP82]
MSISISPTTGPQSGNTLITITDTVSLPLTGITVYFNGVSVPFTRVDATHLTFTLPAGCGVGNCHVSTAGGTSNTSYFYYVSPPIATAISPALATAGSTVTISGYELATTSGVTFGGTAGTAVTAVNDNTVTAVVPAGTGTVPVVLTSVGGTASGLNFAYLPGIPTVTSINPTSGAVGASATFTGTNYTNATGVDFGGVAATSFTVNNDTTLTAVAPAGTGTVNVHVTNSAGTSTDVVTYTYVAGP